MLSTANLNGPYFQSDKTIATLLFLVTLTHAVSIGNKLRMAAKINEQLIYVIIYKH